MITDSYSNMMSDVGINEELGLLMREKRRQEIVGNDRERELNMYRSGSAPPTVEGSLNAVGGLFGGGGAPADFGGVSEEELRSDPAYISYYYSNVNLNPRLPPPLLSKEDWRYAQRLQGGGSGSGRGSSAIGDRRKVNREDDGSNSRSLFAAHPGFTGKKENNGGIESRKAQGGEWGGDGLIGLQGMGLGNRQKSIAEIIQDDASQVASVPRHLSRPASRNAFDDNGESSESHFANLQQELASMDALRSSTPQGLSSASQTYASALGASLSRSTTPTPDHPQFVARAPSPRIPTVGGGRVNSMDKRSEPSDLASALSGMTLSANGMVDEEIRPRSRMQSEINDHQSLFHLQSDQNHVKQQHQYFNQSESGQFHLYSSAQQGKGSYPSMGKGGGHMVDLNNASSLKGSSAPIINNVGSPSYYQNVGSPNSSFSNYGLNNGYGMNPASPSMIGSPLGGGGMPPLFENAAMGGSFPLGPNLIAAAAELQNLSRGGNQNLVDPLYLQYLRSTEYALNDPTLDREANSYLEGLALQKAYFQNLGSLLSSQKSQYGNPYLSQSGSLNHGYYGNSAYGLGMSYPGSPLAGPLLSNSSIGPGSPVRHGERSVRFPSGIRNLGGGVMGSWHPESAGSLDESFASSLLDEFKSNKTKCFELSEIAGHVVEFSADQYGSRFIQQKLETASTEEKDMVFHEIMPHALSLMTDVFGNYVVQKFFEHGTAAQIRKLADQLNGHVLTLSLQMYGCRVIQKAIEVVDLDQQTKMVAELDGHIMRCVRDQNGNHVIQKCIEFIPEDAIQFIVSTFYDQVVTLSTHPYGCRVIQRVLEHCSDPKTQSIVMDEILKHVCMLAQDQYGNYVVQHVLEHGKPHERTSIINQLAGQIVQMSQQKFASNVVEKCLKFGTPEERQVLVTEMLGSTDENEPLQVMMKDQFANYVVQKVLETCDDQQLEMILNRIKVHLNALKKYTYGKHIVARVEKLVAAGERRIGILSSYAAAAAAAAATSTST